MLSSQSVEIFASVGIVSFQIGMTWSVGWLLNGLQQEFYLLHCTKKKKKLCFVLAFRLHPLSPLASSALPRWKWCGCKIVGELIKSAHLMLQFKPWIIKDHLLI